ncbi:MAG TPA: tyrosine-type recombinase/integrase [Verrucomicrobiae bacterium]|nr:tyrosine-type recombinase/integrase [Verrucomicrobiae bacterium]
MKRWDGLVDGYIKWCESRGLRETTLIGLRHELDHWGCWLKRRRPKPNLEEVDGLMLIEYIRSRTRFHAKTTVASVTSKMRCLGEYLVQEGVWRKNPMRWIRGPRLDWRGRMPRRIGKEHLKKIWDATSQNRNVYQQHLSLAVLALLYGTGLRRGELERLDVEHWKREEGILQIDGRKTGRERSVPVSEGIWRCLEAYLPLRQNLLEKRGVSCEPALFLNRTGHRMSSEHLGLMVHRLARKAEVPLVSLHQFRHTCASDLLENGVSLPEVQQLLGHATVVSTTRYLQIADPERARAIQKHPINDYLGLPEALEGSAA